MTNAIVAFLLVHAFGHLVIFAHPWRRGLPGSAAARRSFLGFELHSVERGDGIVQALWLLGSLAFALAAIGAAIHAPWWVPLTAGAAVASAGLCLVARSDAKPGFLLNLFLLVALMAAVQRGLLP